MSRVPTSALVDLIELAKEPSSSRRRDLLRQVTSIFMARPDEINDTEMELYDSIMGQLTADRPATSYEGIALFHPTDLKKRWNGRGSYGIWNCNGTRGKNR